MKLILTRPKSDAEALARRLASLGHDSIALPLLEIVARPNARIPEHPWQAIVFTSANGIQGIGDVTGFENVLILAVGPQSAEAAIRRGFTNVKTCGGDLPSISKFISTNLRPTDGPVLYISGAITSGDLKNELSAAGFSVHQEITYDAVPIKHASLADHLAEADGVLLYSARTAALWNEAVGPQTRLVHFCLSENVAKQLPSKTQIRIAPTADEEGILSLLASRHKAA
jgi:uroporphyrinogen-III synthase